MKKLLALSLIFLLLFVSCAMASESAGLYDLLKTAPAFTAECERLFTISSKPKFIRTAQGACSDGEFLYQAFILKDLASEERNNHCVIIKTSLENGKFVQASEYLSLNHCNDMTYNGKTGQLVISNCSPDPTLVSFVDAKTLTLTGTATLPCGIYALDYNETKDQYIVALKGSRNFRYLNSDFTFANDAVYLANPATVESGSQTVCLSDDLIAFVLWDPNVIDVFDAQGNHLCVIDLDAIKFYEPEGVMLLDGEFYVTCIIGDGKAAFYKITSLTAKE